MKKTLRYVVGIFWGAIASGILAGGYQLNPKEASILDGMLRQDATIFVDGAGKGKSIMGEKLDGEVGATQVSRLYGENQVAGDHKYYGKRIYLRGTIYSINSGLGNKPYLVLKGESLFSSPQAHFRVPDAQKFIDLKKEDKVLLICTGNGAIAGTPMFKDCDFAQDYAEEFIAKSKNDVALLLSGKKLDKQNKIPPTLAVISIALARNLPENSPCFVDFQSSDCKAQLESAMKNAGQLTKDIIVELKGAGVPIPEDALKKQSDQ